MNSAKVVPYLNKVLFCFTLFLFAFIPLYPKFPLINIQGTFVAIRLEDVLIAFTILLWVVYAAVTKTWTFFTKDNIGKAFLLFWFTGIVSLFSAIFITHTIVLHLGFLHYLRRIELMMLLPIIASVFTTKKRLIYALIVLCFTVFVVDIYAIGQQFLDWPVISTTNSEFSKGLILRLTSGARVNSTFAGHYDLAVFLVSVIAILAALFFAFSKYIKIMILALSGFSLYILVLTAARVSFVAAFIGVLSSLVFSRKKKYILLILICLGLVFVYPSQLRDRFVSTLTVNILNLGQRYEGRNLNQQLENKLNIPTLPYKIASRSALQPAFASGSATVSAALPTDITPGEPVNKLDLAVYRSYQIRFNLEWPRAINAFLKNPFTGLGYSSIDLATDNDFLRSLGEIGILGTVAFMLIIISVWKRVYRGVKNEDKLVRYFSAGAASLIVVFLVNGLFIDVFEASKVATLFWMMLGLSLAALKFKNENI